MFLLIDFFFFLHAGMDWIAYLEMWVFYGSLFLVSAALGFVMLQNRFVRGLQRPTLEPDNSQGQAVPGVDLWRCYPVGLVQEAREEGQ